MSLADALERVARRQLDQIFDQAANDLRQTRVESARKRWIHGDPANPFDPHLSLNGLEYTERMQPVALSKQGWDNAVTGTISQFLGDEWFPQDHIGCTCSIEDYTVTETVKVENKQALGDSISADAMADGPSPVIPPGVPASIGARLNELVANDIDDDIGRLWREAVGRSVSLRVAA